MQALSWSNCSGEQGLDLFMLNKINKRYNVCWNSTGLKLWLILKEKLLDSKLVRIGEVWGESESIFLFH